MLNGLDFTLDQTHNIEILLEAAMPGNKYEFLSILAMTILMSNSDSVRYLAKQHPNVSFHLSVLCIVQNFKLVVVGPFGVGKSSAVDVCQWQYCGSRESAKIDPGWLKKKHCIIVFFSH